MTKLLFLTWDADSSNYLESLFIPIFKGIKKDSDFHIHILQFSWADKQEVSRIQELAIKNKITYNHQRITKGKFQKLSALYAVYKGLFFIKNYIQENSINILMPRSTMPAMMTNRLIPWLKNKKVKIIFDADGFPLEERIDFTSLKASDLQYKYLKNEETKLLNYADHILVRSELAKKIHLHTLGLDQIYKITKVTNGRDPDFFNFSKEARLITRAALGIKEDTKLFIYTGSIGPQYALKEMISVFESYSSINSNAYFILLTRSPQLVESELPIQLKEKIRPVAVEFDQVPSYLAAADIAFSLRLPAPSLSGIAPIKLGEYLMMGIPVIASTDVGDTDRLLLSTNFCHSYNHKDSQKISKVIDWINQPKSSRKEIIRFGKQHFSLDLTVKEYLSVLKNHS